MTKKYDKKKYISINDSLIEFAKMLSATGHCTMSQAKKNLTNHQIDQMNRAGLINFTSVDTSKKRIRELYKNGIIDKETHDKELKSARASVEGISFSKRGRNFCGKHLGLKDMYSAPNSLLHNLQLTCKFQTLTKEERDSVKTESQVRKELKAEILNFKKAEPLKYREIQIKYNNKFENFIEIQEKKHEFGSPSDFVYHSSATQTWHSYEVITKSYKEFDIVLKEFSAEILGYNLEMVKV